MMKFEIELEEFTILAEGLDHPEGVAAGPDGSLWAGGEAGQVYRVQFDGTFAQVASTGGFLLGLALDADGFIYACDNGRKAVMRIDPRDGTVSEYFRGTPQRGLVAPNYPVFDDDGRLYVSDSGTFDGHDGCIWVVEPGGEGRILTEDIDAFPNGLALSADGSWLYAVESNGPGVRRVPVANGTQIGQVEQVVELPGTVPDGLAFDQAGGLWIALYAPDQLLRMDPDGGLDVVASDPRRVVLASPTNIAFAGGDRDLLVTSSLGRWHVASTPAPIPGALLRYPRIASR